MSTGSPSGCSHRPIGLRCGGPSWAPLHRARPELRLTLDKRHAPLRSAQRFVRDVLSANPRGDRVGGVRGRRHGVLVEGDHAEPRSGAVRNRKSAAAFEPGTVFVAASARGSVAGRVAFPQSCPAITQPSDRSVQGRASVAVDDHRATPGALPRWPTLVAGSGEHHRDPRPGEALDRERLGISASRRRIRYGSSGPATSKPLRTVSPDRGRRGMPTTTLVAGRSLRIGAGGVLALECSPALGEPIESRDRVGHLHASGSAARPLIGGALGTDRPGRPTSKPLRMVVAHAERRSMPTTTLVAGRSLRVGAGSASCPRARQGLGESIGARDRIGR